MLSIVKDALKLADYVDFVRTKIRSNAVHYKRHSIFEIVFSVIRYSTYSLIKTQKSVINNQVIFYGLPSQKLKSVLNVSEQNYDCIDKYITLSLFDLFYELFALPLLLKLCHKQNVPNEWALDFIISLFVIRKLKKYTLSQGIFIGHIYSLELLSVSILLRESGVKVKCYNDGGFLSFAGGLVCDDLVLRTQFQERYILNTPEQFIFSNLSVQTKCQPLKNNKRQNTIGVYTSGFYARINRKFSKIDYVHKGIEAEKKMLALVGEFAQNYSDMNIRIYIHSHGGVENFEDAAIQYQEILNLPNVRLQSLKEHSIETFPEIDLALTCVSEIFFDRLERGYKCALIGCFESDFCRKTSIENVFIKSVSDIDNFLKMNEKDFFKLLHV